MSPYEVLISVSDQHMSWGEGLFFLILSAWVLSTVVLPVATITVVVVSQWVLFFLVVHMYCCSLLKNLFLLLCFCLQSFYSKLVGTLKCLFHSLMLLSCGLLFVLSQLWPVEGPSEEEVIILFQQCSLHPYSLECFPTF